MPGWEERHSGRLRWELDALQRAGIEPTIDPDAWKDRRLTLIFDWPLEVGRTLRLKAIFPDSFPHIRPQVLLVPEHNPLPPRHCSPLDGNLCLLGRDTRQWLPSWTLYQLLSEQLEKTVSDTGEQDPQGEPAEYWWNALGDIDSVCLIDSAWGLGEAQQGTLELRYVANTQRIKKSGAKAASIPIHRAYVSEVCDQDQTVLHRWQGPLPSYLAMTKSKVRIPWIRVNETIMPERALGDQVFQLWKEHGWLRRGQALRRSNSRSIRPFIIIHPSELGFEQSGIWWIPFILSGHPNTFLPDNDRKKRESPVNVRVLRTYRAGPDDIGHRVPAVALLRQKRILIVGIGAVGAPAAIELARNGCATLHLIEHDLVEPGNTVRWPLGATAWGRSKLDALEEFINREYPSTDVQTHDLCLGQPRACADGRSEDDVLDSTVSAVDLVIDGSASHGVTTLLAECCKNEGIPLISLFATPTLEGGAVVRHSPEGGCPIGLEHAWYDESILSPPGMGSEGKLTQPPGCSERTFIGAGYDLQELSLQAVRLAVDTLTSEIIEPSLIQTLSLVDENGHRCLPSRPAH